MSSETGEKTPSTPQSEHSSDCAVEAAQLLNCIASKKYHKEQCIALLDSLRACVKKHVSEEFGLTCCFTLNMPFE